MSKRNCFRTQDDANFFTITLTRAVLYWVWSSHEVLPVDFPCTRHDFGGIKFETEPRGCFSSFCACRPPGITTPPPVLLHYECNMWEVSVLRVKWNSLLNVRSMNSHLLYKVSFDPISSSLMRGWMLNAEFGTNFASIDKKTINPQHFNSSNNNYMRFRVCFYDEMSWFWCIRTFKDFPENRGSIQ